MEQKSNPGEESPKPEFSRFSVINRDNRLRQAMQALLITNFTMLEAHVNQYPASAPTVTLAGNLLSHLRRYVQGADTLQAAPNDVQREMKRLDALIQAGTGSIQAGAGSDAAAVRGGRRAK